MVLPGEKDNYAVLAEDAIGALEEAILSEYEGCGHERLMEELAPARKLRTRLNYLKENR